MLILITSFLRGLPYFRKWDIFLLICPIWTLIWAWKWAGGFDFRGIYGGKFPILQGQDRQDLALAANGNGIKS